MVQAVREQSPELPATIALPVPLLAQHFQPERWKEEGFASPGDSAAWSNRSCGIACVRMIISYYNGTAPTMPQLLSQGLAMNAYCDKGWIHSGLARLLRDHGVSAQALCISIDQAVSDIRLHRPLVASVTGKLPCDGRKGGHLITLRGFKFTMWANRPIFISMTHQSGENLIIQRVWIDSCAASTEGS